jgi:hypothetical protein
MGSGGAKTQVVKAEETVTPAVARDISTSTQSAQAAQTEARSRMRGIRSTYNRFASGGASAQGNGSASKLG